MLKFYRDVNTLCRENHEYLDKLLRWKNVSEKVDREDILQNLYYLLLTKDYLDRIDGHPDAYIRRVLDGLIASHYNDGEKVYSHRRMECCVGDIDKLEAYNKLSDSTTSVENWMMIDHSLHWIQQQHLSMLAEQHIKKFVDNAIADGDLKDDCAVHSWIKCIRVYRHSRRLDGDILYEDSELQFAPRITRAAGNVRACRHDQPKRGWLTRTFNSHKSYYYGIDIHRNGCIQTEPLKAIDA